MIRRVLVVLMAAGYVGVDIRGGEYYSGLNVLLCIDQ